MNTDIISSATATPAEKLTAIIKATTNSRTPEADAAALLGNLCTLKTVIESPRETLARFVSPATAERLAALLPIIRAYHLEQMNAQTQIRSARDLEQFCLNLSDGRQREGFYVIAVTAQCKVIGTKCISQGSVGEVSCYPREIARFALDVNAYGVFLCHNHPGGTCAPSAEDLASTQQIKRLLQSMDIHTLDHMITASGACYSFAKHGDL